MSREYDVEVCSEECSDPCRMQWHKSLRTQELEPAWWVGRGQFVIPGGIATVLTEVGQEAICPACGTRVGIDEDGPWREDRTECVDAEFLREFDKAWPHEWRTQTYRDRVAVVACVSGEWDEFWGTTLREAMEAMMQAIEEAEDEEASRDT